MSDEIRTTSATGGQKGVKAERHSLMPRKGLDAIARVFGFGATKYADHNWRNGYEWSKSFDALFRHATAANDGETYDPESGLPHLAHAGFHVLVLLTWLAEQGEGADNPYDDRWPAGMERARIEDEEIEWPEGGRPAERLAEIKASAFEVTPLPDDATEEYTRPGAFVEQPWMPPSVTNAYDLADLQPYQDALNDEIARLARAWAPQTYTMGFSKDDVNVDTMRLLVGLPPREPRFEVGTDGTARDLKKPLRADIEKLLDEGWEILGVEGDKIYLINPTVAATPLIPATSWLRDFDVEHPRFGWGVGWGDSYLPFRMPIMPTLDADASWLRDFKDAAEEDLPRRKRRSIRQMLQEFHNKG